MKQMVFRFLIPWLLLTFSIATFSAVSEKIKLCASCHGEQGISRTANWPHLAGQHPVYFIKQMHDYETGDRNSAVMASIVKDLNDEEIEALANYYATLPRNLGSTPQQYLARGEALYRVGDAAQKIPGCIACHGPMGTGNNWAGFPVLSGQSPLYTIDQLQAFKKQQRKNDSRQIMQDICSRMTETDIVAVAYYLSGLH